MFLYQMTQCYQREGQHSGTIKSTEYLFCIIYLIIYAEFILSLKLPKHIIVKFLFDKWCFMFDFHACASKETAYPLSPFKNKHLTENPFPHCVTNQTADAVSSFLPSAGISKHCLLWCVPLFILVYTCSACYTLYYMDCIIRIKTHIAAQLLFIGFTW